jgi:hypothetical protein
MEISKINFANFFNLISLSVFAYISSKILFFMRNITSTLAFREQFLTNFSLLLRKKKKFLFLLKFFYYFNMFHINSCPER